MSNQPRVCCVMLTKDRPAMAKRAIECFRSQTYQNKRLYIYDTGERPCVESLPDRYPDYDICYHRGLDEGVKLGMLRNRANWWAVRPNAEAPPDVDVIAHLDDDDWSHPNRIAEQVALLQASGKQVVGYREMLFWRMINGEPQWGTTHIKDSAWLYRNNDPRYIVGTSLCYWRKAWEAKPFNPKLPERRGGTGEDNEWIRGLDTLGETGMFRFSGPSGSGFEDLQPRIIASIHGSNTSDYQGIEKHPGSWTRVPEWDEHCRKVMSL